MKQGDLVLLHLGDWNYEDKWYELPANVLREFYDRIKRDGMRAAWGWFTPQVDYGGNPERPIKRRNEATELEEYFLDYNNPNKSTAEWY